ncbi:MAG: Rpn family recombination-promoting nuclease/putative transposase [Candidatus Aminicenantes bacterium]|nr:Rpn family recombination-promoting nuclease/putative transposase [Candidatus Aminicenantes bacterium]
MKSGQEKKKTEHITAPHDKVVKAFFSEMETARSFFQEYLPAEMTKDMDFSSLKFLKDTFIDKKLSVYFSDLLFQVKLKNIPVFIYLLIEHKSWPERFTAFQLLKYKVKIWELYLKQQEGAGTLPVILPIVIYHGYREWNIDTSFISLFDDNLPGYVKEYIPDFRYYLQDISRLPDEEIKGAVLLRILLKTLKYIFTPGLNHRLPEIFQLFHELKDKNKGTEFLEVLLRYLTNSARNLTDEELKESVTKVIIEGGDLMSTIAEKWVEKGKWDVVKNSLKEGLPIDTIKKITGFPVEKINRVKEEMSRSREYRT